MKSSLLAALATASSSLFGLAQSQLVGVPTVPYKGGEGQFKLQDAKSIVINKEFSQRRDENGVTLIPPTLQEFANTFAEDLSSTLGIDLEVVEGTERGSGSIFLTLGDANDYLDAAGRPTSEGYTLATDDSGIVITGASPLGAWWGTRTVLQQALLNEGASVPIGSGVDAPGWSERGMMLDAGRHFYPKEFVVEMCSYMSFFKQNLFHLHISDNVIIGRYEQDNFKDLYARFRLWSESPEVEGLNNHRNESYSRDEFDEIQNKCAARGVTILPEIEAPGHSLPFVQWRPQIGYEGDLSLLNLTHPDTVPTLKTVWKEFLPWFHSKIVSIGADEYFGPEAEYKGFVNTMNTFIGEESGKTIRIWGTFPPKGQDVEVESEVSLQHWSYQFGNALNDWIANNHTTINSNDQWYIVLKYGAYGRTIDTSMTFTGNPSDKGPWYPHIFSPSNATDNPARDEPLVRGSIIPMWNDHGFNTSVYSEAYYAWRQGIPALADKMWGGELTQDQFPTVFDKLHPHIPGQNLERAVDSQGATVFEYDLTSQSSQDVPDRSPNGYDAKTACEATGSSLRITPDCGLQTPLGSKGRNYTLSASLKVDELADATNTTLVAGADSVLMLTPNLTLYAAGVYFRLNSTFPLNVWVDLEIIGRDAKTFARVTSAEGGQTGEEEEFLAGVSSGAELSWVEMAIEAPIREVTGWTGSLKRFKLTNEA
ncbi:hypothetical protein ACO1O0_003590 [Amphichorda felina]